MPTGEGPMGLGYFLGKSSACPALKLETPHNHRQPMFLPLSQATRDKEQRGNSDWWS